MINLGHKLGLTVIAEGVDAKAEMEHLHRLSCDYIQGNYFSQALPPADLAYLLEENSGAKTRV